MTDGMAAQPTAATGAASSAHRTSILRLRRRLASMAIPAFGYFGFAFLYTPIFFLILFSFNDHIIPSLPFRGFTLKWYNELGYDFVMHEALYNSLFIASWTTVISTTIATLAAFPLVRRRYRLKVLSQLLVVLPMVIPHFLLGVALLIFFTFVNMPLSRLTIILGHVVFTLPFAIMVISTRLHGFDRTLELAAADLGADPRQTFRFVVLPIILPGIVGAALLVFALSMDEFLITYFVSGQKGTITMHIWSLLKDGIAPRVNALATVLILASFILLIAGNWLSGGASTRERRR
ncbi:MAG: ABC transporter permease [Hyphomicrobiaceae bacterium]